MMTETPASIVQQEVSRWLETDDEHLAVAPLVAAVANRLLGPPVWLVIVAPPSSGKSEVITALSGLPGVHFISQLSDKTLASGKRREPGDPTHLSLLKRFESKGTWLLAIKDFGTIMSLNLKVGKMLMAQLREVYDGGFSASYGTGVEVDWKGKLGLIAGATSQIDRAFTLNAQLGERFVYFRPRAPERYAVALAAVASVSDEAERKTAMAAAYRRAYELAEPGFKDAALAPEAQRIVAHLADLVATARTPVTRPRDSFDGFEVGDTEGPARVGKVLAQLHRAATVCYAGDVEAASRLVVRIGVDSIPRKRSLALRQLAANPAGVTIHDVAGALRCDDQTAQRELESLVALDLAKRERPANQYVYRASPNLLFRASQIVPDADQPNEALARLFGVEGPTQIHKEKAA